MNVFYSLHRQSGCLAENVKLSGQMSVRKSQFRLCSVLFILLFSAASVFAQDVNVTGKVTDSKGDGVPGVAITIKGTTRGTNTDVEGKYQFSAPAAATLTFSSIGFETKDVLVGNAATINVTLTEDIKSLQEVVVVGYGTQKVKDATGSVASLSPKDFNKGVIASPEQLLQGRVAGVQMTPASGEPGAGISIRIRGAGSIRSGNNPLFVIDGVPIGGGGTSGGLDAGAGASAARNPLAFLNPNDIENFSVLKDASSAAIYGSRGANGVILITTKKGRKGQGFNFSANTSVSSTAKRYDMLNAADFLKGIKAAGGDITGGVDQGADTDWQDQIYRTAVSQNYDLGYGGATDNTRYRFTVGYADQKGIIKNSGLKRLSGRLNMSQDLFKDKVVIDLALTGADIRNTYAPISDNAGAEPSLIGASIQSNPTYPVKNPDGTFYHPGGNSYRNAADLLANIDDSDKIYRWLGNLSATWKITKSLSYKYTIGMDNLSSERTTWFDPRLQGFDNGSNLRGVSIPRVSTNGRGVIQNIDQNSLLIEHTVNYTNKLGKGILEALAGYSYQKYNNYGYANAAWGQKTTVPFKKEWGAFSDVAFKGAALGDSSRSELQSFFGRANYSIGDKYFFTGTLRVDGSSKLGDGNKYGYFPALAAKWKLMNEAFIPKNVFSDLSLRLNWGITGNQEFGGGITKAVNRRNTNGTETINAASPDITWETTTQYGAGIDFAFLDGRLSGTVDYFNKQTKDLLFLANYAQPAAVTQRWVNLPGIVRNTGVEVSLGLQAVQQNKFTWEVLYNMSFLKNKVEDFGDAFIETGAISGKGLTGAYAQTIANGYPLGSFYMQTSAGFDKDGHTIFLNEGLPSVVGSALPKFNFGLTNNFTLGNWNASLFVNGQTGNYIYNNTANALFTKATLAGGGNVTYKVYNSNEATDNPPAVTNQYLEKGNFVRISNFSLGYTFQMKPESKIKSLRLSVSGQNLALFTKYSGLDPEVNTNKEMNGVPSIGIDYISYPNPRTFTFGVNVGF